MLIELLTCLTVSMICGDYDLILLCILDHIYMHLTLYKLFKLFFFILSNFSIVGLDVQFVVLRAKSRVKYAFLSGITITILLIPVNKWIFKLIASATNKMIEQKNERIRRTGEILMNICTLKMYAWELLFSSWLMETRSTEVKHLSTRKYLDAWCVFFWATTPTLFSLFTFGLYSLMGHQLDAAMVFTSLALFNSLISPLNSFQWVINGLINAIISIRRLSRFLYCSEHELELEEKGNIPSSSSNEQSDMAVVIHDASYAWSSSVEQMQDLILDHVTLYLPNGLLVAVIGKSLLCRYSDVL
ncbi:ABC transporter C family member 13-like isoform X2 [Actinidia eriantha]|uniref:ABC transporter C family member 13-like isoform X2 n=1 Tax=Actinidia eriantha TaxID=165200 RepID=UPI002585F4AE|nr:ABC transporter C family member 13-like isoform X2 [Actinidia eriantha]XP_057460872.1 ABC transporter C family member 13-like isoform X2 [Actinidia eriantha]